MKTFIAGVGFVFFLSVGMVGLSNVQEVVASCESVMVDECSVEVTKNGTPVIIGCLLGGECKTTKKSGPCDSIEEIL